MNVAETHKVAIFAPRLDCSFKEGPYSASFTGPFGTPNHTLREHWERFLILLGNIHESFGDEVTYIIKPLWKMSPSDVEGMGYDRIYIPHKHKFQFDCGPGSRYYMQMVIPNIFSIDEEGWCAGASTYPIVPNPMFSGKFCSLRSRIWDNQSKFPQPPRDASFVEENYILFLCQIPHDETIKIHSDISVADALRNTLKLGKKLDKKVIVKGHPINPASMTALKKIVEEENGPIWVDNMNLHQLIEQCDFVATVNSGSGLEALLHHKRVLAFGRADYDGCLNVFSSPDEIELAIKQGLTHNPYDDVKFIETWYQNHYDVNFLPSFEKLLYK